MPNTTVYRKDYQSPIFTIETVDLNFDLYDDHAIVCNKMKLKRQREGILRLHGDELKLVSIALNGVTLYPSAYHFIDDDLIIKQAPDEIILDIVTRVEPQNNTELSGLYRSNHLFCTQCEAEGFRRITYFLDRPDVLAVYTTRITADKTHYPTLLSNGNLIDSGDTEGGRHWALWKDPFKKPSYLFALVAGNLACVQDKWVTASGKKVDLRIYVEPGNEDKCSFAMESLKNAMRWDEKVYGREYDLDIFMIVAVSDFNMGAMENKGLNIFNSKYILARPDTATDDDYVGVESVVAHEYFHNWTGNRVTCRDWFQLSLKEGLTVFRDQEFSRDMNSRDVYRIADVDGLRNGQFPEDAGSMAHPVRPESYEEINNFYTATIYSKGAEVIRMQHTLLGKSGFRKGMDLYFQRHDGQAVTIDDFVAAMENANEVDLTQFKLWYSQAGTPVVQATSEYKNHTLTLTLKQSCPTTPDGLDKKPFHIPIRMALFNAKGQSIYLKKKLLELKESEQKFVFNNLKERPVVSLLREFSAPIRLQFKHSQKELLFLMRYETDGFAKWDAAQRLVLNCLSKWLKIPKEQWSIPKALISAFKYVLLDDSLDTDLRDELISPPGFEEVANLMDAIDVTLVEDVRDVFTQQLGIQLFPTLKRSYHRLWEEEGRLKDFKEYEHRGLRSTSLCLMMRANEFAALDACKQQFFARRTMTDQLSSFALLVNCSDEISRQEAIDVFYREWSKEDLVLDKWFAIQSASRLPNTLNQVKRLLEHPNFNIKNPNKVRAVVGAFCIANHRHFHVPDGSGYRFLGEMLVKIDKINAQIAARLASPFTRWQSYDAPRQALMKQQLDYLATLKLSRDLKEVVTKSLAGESLDE